ncbi:hypothetical protein PFISCL1PPCAC_7897, partial [Pristionchus fissidentatus]
ENHSNRSYDVHAYNALLNGELPDPGPPSSTSSRSQSFCSVITAQSIDYDEAMDFQEIDAGQRMEKEE